MAHARLTAAATRPVAAGRARTVELSLAVRTGQGVVVVDLSRTVGIVVGHAELVRQVIDDRGVSKRGTIARHEVRRIDADFSTHAIEPRPRTDATDGVFRARTKKRSPSLVSRTS